MKKEILHKFKRLFWVIYLLASIASLISFGCARQLDKTSMVVKKISNEIILMRAPHVLLKMPSSCSENKIYKRTGDDKYINNITCNKNSIYVYMEVKRLLFPLESQELWHALLRVETQKLGKAGAVNISEFQPAILSDLLGSKTQFNKDHSKYVLIIVRSKKWLYKLTMKSSDDINDHMVGKICSGVLIDKSIKKIADNREDAPNDINNIRKLLDAGDPPSLKEAEKILKKQIYPKSQIYLYEMYVLKYLAYKRHARKYDQRDWERLLGEFQKIGFVDMSDSDSVRVYGLIQMMAGNLADSESILEKAARDYPATAEQYWALAIWNSVNLKKQAELARKSISIKPSLARARLLLFDNFIRLNDIENARDQLLLILKDYPDNTSALLELARLSMDNEKDMPHSKSYLIKILNIDPSDTAARYNISLILLRQNKMDEALGNINLLLSSLPKDIDALRLKSKIYINKKMYLDAIEPLQKAVGIDPNCAQCFYNMGVIAAVNLNDLKLARYSFNRFLLLKKEGPRAENIKRWLRTN